MKPILFGLVSLALCVGKTPGDDGKSPDNDAGGKATALEIFEQRITPIFKSAEPSSCIQCHLASVDLKDYILPSHEKTFLSLRDQGLVDVDNPEKSKILTLIRMGDKDLDKGAKLIHEKTRRMEYEAFSAWIVACCSDPKLANLPKLSDAERARPQRPDPVIRHARRSRVIDSFVRKVWSQRMRCFPCHTPHEIDDANPKQKLAVQRLQEFKKKYSRELMDRLPIFKATPEATVQYLVDQSRKTPEDSLPLLNLQDPAKSLLVLKPTSKLPKKNEAGKFDPASSTEPVSHMGGLKMHPDDQSYKSFVSWIKDYALTVSNEYKSVADLPKDNWYPTKHIIRLRGAPWPAHTRVQLFVYAWSQETDSWNRQPVAFTQGTVTPRKLVNGALFRLANSQEHQRKSLDPEQARLEPGKYLVKVYVDSQQRLAQDPTVILGDDDLHGEVEIAATWREGFRRPESISARQLSK